MPKVIIHYLIFSEIHTVLRALSLMQYTSIISFFILYFLQGQIFFSSAESSFEQSRLLCLLSQRGLWQVLLVPSENIFLNKNEIDFKDKFCHLCVFTAKTNKTLSHCFKRKGRGVQNRQKPYRDLSHIGDSRHFLSWGSFCLQVMGTIELNNFTFLLSSLSYPSPLPIGCFLSVLLGFKLLILNLVPHDPETVSVCPFHISFQTVLVDVLRSYYAEPAQSQPQGKPGMKNGIKEFYSGGTYRTEISI